MKKRNIIAAMLIVAGIAIVAVPISFRLFGEQKANELMQEFEEEIKVEWEETDSEETGKSETKGQATLSEEDAAIFKEGDVIGIVEIKSIGIRYPIMEGTSSSVLNSGIGHITETAGIGSIGNCVICGHNSSRHGEFFTNLSKVAMGEEITILDKDATLHRYEVVESFVTHPYDNSIKNQGEEETLTLFTCENRGSMRFVVKCKAKEELDE